MGAVIHAKIANVSPSILMDKPHGLTIPLHRQQLDFMRRMQERSSSPGSSLLLNHGHPGVWSEQVTISGDRLSQIRAQCRQRILHSDPTQPVSELWQQYLLEALADAAASLVWSQQLVPIEETPNSFYWRESGSDAYGWTPRVQVLALSGPPTSDLIYPQEVKGSDILLWVAVEESLDDAYQDYHPIILGFLPSDRLPRQRPFSSDHLCYGGGLEGYIQLARPPLSQSSNCWLPPLMAGAIMPIPSLLRPMAKPSPVPAMMAASDSGVSRRVNCKRF